MTMTMKYRKSTVEVFDLAVLEGDETISLPRWVLDYIRATPQARARGYLVLKPDNSVENYTEDALNQEFEIDKDSV